VITHIFCDVGGVVLDEDDLYRVYLGEILKTLRAQGIGVADHEFDRAVRKCILSWVPVLRRAVIWHFTRPDVAQCDAADAAARAGFQKWSESAVQSTVPGIEPVLRELAARFTLVLAANAGAHVKETTLRKLNFLRFFENPEVSEEIGFAKPDLRFFQHLLAKSGAVPDSCIMIGDRLDNDIVPAKSLGMRTIWVKRGPYRILAPRTPEEIPDALVANVAALPETIAALAATSET
jgi:HAD superfamily hydrolase (TIGR01509 family)